MSPERTFSSERSLITAKMSKLREYQGFLRELQKTSREEFIGDFKVRGAVERYLQVSIESVVDIGNEIISSLQLRRPERYREIPYILAEAEIIPKTLAEAVASMIGFRNLLVHDYASIDLDLVYEFLQTKLPDFEVFTRYVAEWLEKTASRL